MKIKEVFPLLNPTDLVFGGWDINDDNLAKAMKKAEVFEYDLQQKLIPYMEKFKPLRSIYYPDFIASNQTDRANNIIEGNHKKEHL
jgi:myo-inositol-1-phosphate synthase